MSITIRYNGSSIHLQGIAASTPYTGNGDDNETGVVAYYAESACGSLTRNGSRMVVGHSFETATEALKEAHAMAGYRHGLKVCKNCEKAAQLSAETETPEAPEAEAPAVDDHAAVAKMRANIDAEEEERAAARRARNRTNYAPDSKSRTEETTEIEDRMTIMNEFQVQKRNGGVVHTGYEHAGFISSGCGAGHSHNQGLDNVTRTWVKVDAAVTCKRCLKNRAAQQPKAEPQTTKATKVRKATEAELWKEERKAAEPKPAPFTFEYDATAGILIAAALRGKAKDERRTATEYRKARGQLSAFYAEQARDADHRAQLLEDAADAIHGPVKTALAEDMGRAIDRADKPFHGQVKDAIGLTW